MPTSDRSGRSSSLVAENAGCGVRSKGGAIDSNGETSGMAWELQLCPQSSAFRGLGELWRTFEAPMPCQEDFSFGVHCSPLWPLKKAFAPKGRPRRRREGFRSHTASSHFASRLAKGGGLSEPARFRRQPLPVAAVLLNSKKRACPLSGQALLVWGIFWPSAPQSARSARSR